MFTEDTVFPQDRFCIVDQAPIEDNSNSLYCSSECRQKDSNTGLAPVATRGNLITYRTRMHERQPSSSRSISRRLRPIDGSVMVTSNSIDSSSDEEDFVPESTSYEENSNQYSVDIVAPGEELDDVFQFEGVTDTNNVYSSSLPSLMSDLDNGSDTDDFSNEDELASEQNRNSTKYYEWLYDVPKSEKETLSYGFSTYEKKIDSLIIEEKRHSNIAARNYELWLTSH